MARLPVPGQDAGTWGGVLNEFLSVAHNPDGSLKAFVNVKDFGAVGDENANDTAAIQAAINANNKAPKIVFFPAGTYKTTAPLTIVGSGIYLVGAGIYSSRIKGPDTSIILDFGDGGYQYHGCGMEKLAVTRQTAGGAITVRLRKQDQFRAEACSIAAGTTSLDMSGSVANHISNCSIFSQTVNAIRIDNSDQVMFTACSFETNFSTTATHMRFDSGNKAIAITGCIFSTAKYALFADGGPSNDITISGCNIENCDNGFFIAPTGSAASTRWSITGNVLRGKAVIGSEGMRLYGSSHAIVGNLITNYTTSINEVGTGVGNNLIVGNRTSSAINVTSAGSIVTQNLIA